MAVYDTEAVINGNTYRRLEGGFPYTSSIPDFFVREDTTSKKVYYRMPLWGDTAEHVLYDYNLNVGDTIRFSGWSDSLVAMDSIPINGVYHKWFDFTGKSSTDIRVYTVIEGIGCTAHPFFPVTGRCFEFYEALLCFRQNGIPPTFGIRQKNCYLPHITSLLNCSTLEIGQEHTTEGTFSISPSPANAELSISINTSRKENTLISVYDLSGRCILRTQPTRQHSTTLATAEWPTGIYLVVVDDGSGELRKEKVTIEH